MSKYKASLDGMRRNKKTYERISEEIAARGFVRSLKQCRNKININGCIGEHDSRVDSTTRMPRFFSRPCWADEQNMWQTDDA